MNRYVFSLILIVGCSGVHLNGTDSTVDVTEVQKTIKSLTNNLELESAKNYIREIAESGRSWCLIKYSDGRCKKKSNTVPKQIAEYLSEMEKCVPHAMTCKSESLSKQNAKSCIEGMERYCRISRPEYTGHPYPHNIILENAKNRLPNLKFSNEQIDGQIADAYNRCEEGQKWGYHVTESPISSGQVYFARTARSKIVGNFNNETDCHRARLASDPAFRRGLEFDTCTKRYVGESIMPSIYKAQAFYKSGGYATVLPSMVQKTVTFSSQEKCQKAIYEKREYSFQLTQNEYDKVMIHPYGSTESNRFITDCTEEKVEVCKNGTLGFNQIEFYD